MNQSTFNNDHSSGMLNRRDWLQRTSAAALAGSFLSVSARAEAHNRKVPQGKAEHCIMLWLGGGASQIDTFDPKHQSIDNSKDPGSDYAAIDTVVPGVKVSEHLKQTANLLDRCALVRTLHHDEIDEHAAASYRMHIGRRTSGTITYPSLGSVVTHRKEKLSTKVPSYVLMGYPSPGRQPGFLGPQHGFVYLTDTESGPKGLSRPTRITKERLKRREDVLQKLASIYSRDHKIDSQIAAYMAAAEQGRDLAGPEFMSVFNLQQEPSDLRNQYGGEFGQRCLLARRLIERGTRFVEVSFNLTFVNGTGWDTHNEGQLKQHLLIQGLDQAFATLLKDLEQKKLLDKTLVVIATEFGRPARFDAGGGRGHHAKAFSGVLAGAGLKTGQAIGQTDELGELHVSGPKISVPDWFATIYAAMGIDYTNEMYAGDRPVPLTDGGNAIAELFS